jgi:MFS family permease
MFAMVAFGFGEIFGGLIIGQVVDRKNSKIASLYNLCFVAFTTILTLSYLSIRKYNWFVFFVSFMWGFEDGSVNTHCLEMLGFEFEDNIIPFSIFSLFEALAVFLFQIIQSFVDHPSDPEIKKRNYMIYIGISGFLGAMMCGCTYFFDFKEKRSKSDNY